MVSSKKAGQCASAPCLGQIGSRSAPRVDNGEGNGGEGVRGRSQGSHRSNLPFLWIFRIRPSLCLAVARPFFGRFPCPAWLLWEPTEGRRWVKKTPGAIGVVLRFAWATPKALGRAVYSWSARLPERASCLVSGGGRSEEEVRSWGAVARVGAGAAMLRLNS